MDSGKNDFEPFAVGTIFNPLSVSPTISTAPCKRVVIKYPSRLEAMALDPPIIITAANISFFISRSPFKLSERL